VASNQKKILVDWVENQLHCLSPGDLFPSTVSIAKRFLVSPATVRRVFQEFRQRGSVSCTPGKGVHIPLPAPLPESQQMRRCSSAEAIADQLALLITSGRYRVGTALPSVKYISLQFRVRPATVIEAYQTLGQRGLVTKIGRRHAIGSFGNNLGLKVGRRIICSLEHTSNIAELFGATHVRGATMQALEKELVTQGFRLDIAFHKDATQGADEFRNPKDKVAGVILPYVGRSRFEEFRRRLQRVNPAAIDTVRFLVECDQPPGSRLPNVCHWSAESLDRAVAASVVSFVLKMGFRSIHLHRSFPEGDDESTDLLRVVQQKLQQAAGRIMITLSRGRNPEPPRLHLDGGKEAPALWVFTTDREALNGYTRASAAGIQVPQQLSVLSLENGELSRMHGLSCCAPDTDRTGYLLAHSLIGDIEVDRTDAGEICGAAYLIERQTTP